MVDCQSKAPKPRRRRSATWKDGERKVAALLDPYVEELVERVPVTGRALGSAPDIRHPWYALEMKHGFQIPKLVLRAFKQAIAAVRGSQIPVVILHPFGGRYEDSLVIVRLRDLDTLRSYGRSDLRATPATDSTDLRQPG